MKIAATLIIAAFAVAVLGGVALANISTAVWAGLDPRYHHRPAHVRCPEPFVADAVDLGSLLIEIGVSLG